MESHFLGKAGTFCGASPSASVSNRAELRPEGFDLALVLRKANTLVQMFWVFLFLFLNTAGIGDLILPEI